MSGTTMTVREWRLARWLLFGLVLVVTLPSLTVLGLYMAGWRPSGQTSHGTFLAHPTRLDGIQVRRTDGAKGALLRLGGLQGKWTLIYLMPADCGRTCVASLYGLRMAHLGQMDQMHRVQRVVLAASAEQARDLAGRDPGLAVFYADAGQRAALRQRLGDGSGELAGEGLICLMDPLGNVILRYRQDTDPRGIRKDLTHLMKHSWVG